MNGQDPGGGSIKDSSDPKRDNHQEVSIAKERRRVEELASREKLKEELLRQYEAGQLKASKEEVSSKDVPTAGEIQKLLSDYKMDGEKQQPQPPRQIPTIEEQRAAALASRRSVQPPPRHTIPAAPRPDLSRPPPGYVPAVQVPLYQPVPQPIYSYGDNIVTRVLQSLMSTKVQHQQELVSFQSQQEVLNKVLSWDDGQRTRRNLSEGNRRSVEVIRSKSRERRRSRSRMRSYGDKRKRKSLSVEVVSRPVDSSSKRRRRSRSKFKEPLKDRNPRKESPRSKKHKSVERQSRRSDHHHSSSRRDLSPLTRTCSSKIEKSGDRKRRHENYSDGYSPRSRKIVLLSPVRMKKSVREVIMDERDMRVERSPVKKRIKDRLGWVKKDLADVLEVVEVYNMDNSKGKCGAVAIVKEYIDSKSGIMELRTSEGGRGAVILFSAEHVWIADRKHDPNGPPKLYVESNPSSHPLHTFFPIGQEVLINARKVESRLVDMQASAVWPKFTEIPEYKIRYSKLEEKLEKFHEVSQVDKLVPICINGLAPVGSLNIWSARVRQIVDKEWGVVEVKSVPRDGKREFSFRFFCIFHKSDVWTDEGLRVGEHSFYNDKSLNEIVELLQPVDIVARSIIREKGQAMKKALGSTVEMQAICVSLKPSCIPAGAPRGTRVAGGPGAFGGSNRGETPYMFKKGLEHSLNVKLAQYLTASGKVCHNLDPNLMVNPKGCESAEKVAETEKKEKKVHKLTKTITPFTPDVETVTVDSQNNVVIAKPKPNLPQVVIAKPNLPLFEKLSNSTARVRKYCTESVGLLENLTKDWTCMFQISDCVLTQGSKPQELYPVGAKVQLNANLIDIDRRIQYLASCVWYKSDNALVLPNIVEKPMISTEKLDLYNEINLLMDVKASSGRRLTMSSHLQLVKGNVIKVLDDNFGVIKQAENLVLFDTCDFWTSHEATAAQSSHTLPKLLSVGDTVLLHAALVQPSSSIPYLATAVWLANPSPFPSDKCPIAIRRDKIHPDKIKIYEMVSRCTAVKQDLPVTTVICERSSPDVGNVKVHDMKGLVKFAFKLKESSGLSAAIVEFSKEPKHKKYLAFYLSSQSVESHEKTKICVPNTKVCFNAVPVTGEKFPVSHIATAVSYVHTRLPPCEDSAKIVDLAIETLNRILELVPELTDLESAKPKILSVDFSAKSKSKTSNLVVDCFPTGRLVCMLNESSGIMEDHRRELAYFEKTDLNLPSDLEMKDIVMVMTRCRDVTIRFQASQVMDGPVRMIVNDGTVAISSNLERYFPEVEVIKPKICMKPNSFPEEKITRAKAAVELYKVDKILTPDYIIDSGEYSSKLVKPKRYISFSSSANTSLTSLNNSKQAKSLDLSNPKVVKTLIKKTGKVKNILNDNFGLLEFCQDDAKATYCLFDTYDLYLEGGKTAAQSKLTVANVLAPDMEVCFNACEMSPGTSVPWLANGVWRPDVTSHPKPVPHSRVTKEKVAVFMKVAESCALLVSVGLPFSLSSGSDKAFDSSCKSVEKIGVHKENIVVETVRYEENVQEVCVAPLKKIIDCEVEENEIPLNEVKSVIQTTVNVNDVSTDEVNEHIKNENILKPKGTEMNRSEIELGADKNEKPEVEEAAFKLSIKEEVVEEKVEKVVGNKFDMNVDDIRKGTEGDEDALKAAEGLKENNSKVDLTKEVLESSLPEMLSDQVTVGTLSQELSQQFAIVTLNCPVGTKALLHCGRVWVNDHPMRSKEGAESGWEELTKTGSPDLGCIRINARKVQGYEDFDYQVTFAHLGVTSFNVEVGKFSYTNELAKFANTKEDVELLDKQLKHLKGSNLVSIERKI